MKTEATQETEATSPDAARPSGRGFALKAPGHRMPAVAQRRASAGNGAVFGADTPPIMTGHETGPLDVQAQGGSSVLPATAAPRANNTGLPDRLKAGVEQLSGLAMDDVRVHYNSPRPAQLQALAYTQGADIHVGPGQERHLPHEAWHVVQQKQGRVSATLQMTGVAINDDAGLEREAERIGALAARPGALALSPGCGCATCASRSGVPGGGAHRILPVRAPSQIGQRSIIQRVKCPTCGWRVRAGETRCPACFAKMPVVPASAAPAKSGAGAAAKAAKAVADKAVAGKGKSAEAKAAPTHTIRIQLQLVDPKVELSEVVHHYDGTPITAEEAIEALDALLRKAKQAGVAKAKLKDARDEVAPAVRRKIRQGAIGPSESTYFTTSADKNRIDVENVRGNRNFTPAAAPAAASAAAAGAAAPAAAGGAAAPAAVPAAAAVAAAPAAAPAGAAAPAAAPTAAADEADADA